MKRNYRNCQANEIVLKFQMGLLVQLVGKRIVNWVLPDSTGLSGRRVRRRELGYVSFWTGAATLLGIGKVHIFLFHCSCIVGHLSIRFGFHPISYPPVCECCICYRVALRCEPYKAKTEEMAGDRIKGNKGDI